MALSFTAATKLIAEREIRTYVRTKGFWISFGITIVALFAMTVLPSFFSSPTKVAVVGSEAKAALSAGDFELREVADLAAAEELLRSEDVSAAVVPDPQERTPSGLRVVALENADTEVVVALAQVPPVDLIAPGEISGGQQQAVVTVFGLLFLMFGMGGMAIAQSTVSEKQTRIVEILVSTIPVRALLAGKIVGNAVLTIGQLVVLAAVAPIALKIGGQDELLGVVAPAIGWFIPFLILGFVLLAGMWAMAGALISRQEDLGSSTGSVVMLVMLPYFGVLFLFQNKLAMTIMSYVPFTAPVAMPLRVFSGEAAPWEALVSLALLAGAGVLVLLFASKVFTGSLLHTGGKLKIKQALATSKG